MHFHSLPQYIYSYDTKKAVNLCIHETVCYLKWWCKKGVPARYFPPCSLFSWLLDLLTFNEMSLWEYIWLWKCPYFCISLFFWNVETAVADGFPALMVFLLLLDYKSPAFTLFLIFCGESVWIFSCHPKNLSVPYLFDSVEIPSLWFQVNLVLKLSHMQYAFIIN